MSQDPETLELHKRDQLALAPPRMTILSDRPLRAAEAHRDSLDLAVKLGPIYDILRHPDTRTPLAVAIYGDWGSGKTSAMKWLEGLLREWNQRGEHGADPGDARVVRPVWFYPWKYDDKDDVWRGLIAEVILASLDVREATEGRVRKALKEFGAFLGRSFLHVLRRMKVVEGVELLDDIAREYEATGHPESAYLNEFETTLRTWVRETISNQNERMVIFIDDLDRCMPEVALQVLEALKLYLNIEDLIFVVGVDRSVVDQLLRKLYGRLGLQADKSKHYLAKMFQVEVTIGPSERQAGAFLNQQIDAIGERTNEYWSTELSDAERRVFREVVLALAERNPREIKRLLNSVLIHGAGVMHVTDRMTNQRYAFAQGMQVYLVRRILDERYTMGLAVDTLVGMEFLHGWSNIVHGENIRPHIDHPDEQAERLMAGGKVADEVSPFLPLLSQPRFAHLRHLLGDRELGLLMTVEYPADTTPLAETSQQDLPSGLILEAVARILSKHPSQLTAADYQRITEFDISDDISDITALGLLGALTKVDLAYTNVVDIRPIGRLDKLEVLNLNRTPVAELGPLRALRGLRHLYLGDTKVTGLGPLANLTGLRSLNLRNTAVADIAPLAGLHALEVLNLTNTRVSRIEPLLGLTGLRELSVHNCRLAEDDLVRLRMTLSDTVIHA